MLTYLYAYVCMCVEARGLCRVSSSIASPWQFLRQGLSVGLSARLTVQQVPGTLLLLLLQYCDFYVGGKDPDSGPPIWNIQLFIY